MESIKETEEKIMDKEIKLFKDALPSLRFLRKKGYKLALATSAMPPMVRFAKKRFRIAKYFDKIVYSKEVKHTKPAPDLFLLAAKKLKVSPKECVVIEDAVNGVIAAKKAS